MTSASESVAAAKPGQWGVFRGWGGHSADVYPIEAVSPGRIVIQRHAGGRKGHKHPSDLIAALDDKTRAEQLKQAIDGARGEYDRRVTAAYRAMEAAIAKLVAAAHLAREAGDGHL